MTSPSVGGAASAAAASTVAAQGSSSNNSSLLGGVISDFLECSVCLEPLDLNHRVLPCQHTFCLSCLDDLATKKKKSDPGDPLFLCPECRAEVRTPISSLPTNVILNRILSGINQSSAKINNEVPLKKTSGIQPPPPPLAIGEHRKLPLPVVSSSSPAPLKFDNNNIPGKKQGFKSN